MAQQVIANSYNDLQGIALTPKDAKPPKIDLNDPLICSNASKEFREKIVNKKGEFDKAAHYYFVTRKNAPDAIYYFNVQQTQIKYKNASHSSLITENEEKQAIILYAGEFNTDQNGNIQAWSNKSDEFVSKPQHVPIFANTWGLDKVDFDK